MTPTLIERFSFAERLSHWISAACFLYAAFTGLALWSPGLYWLSAVFGGGDIVRGWHPWAGVLFFVALGAMFRRWAGQMRIDRDDRVWLSKSHLYAQNIETGMPDTGRFNAGQKMLFWTQAVCALLLLLSGAILWFPESAGRGLSLAAVLIHPAAAAISITGILVHLYMSTMAVPGSLGAMVRGRVSERWARSHHARWYRESRPR